MMINKIIHATILQPDNILRDHTIEISNGKITAIYPTRANTVKGKPGETLDASNLLVTPGLIDIHIHGCAGADTMDARQESLETISTYLVRHGVTSFFTTTVTNSREKITTALQNIAKVRGILSGASLLGAHVEGPYINLSYKGAQNPEYFRNPQMEEFSEWLDTGVIKLITIAPELDGADELIKTCIDNDIEIAIGHSEASFDQVIHAADIGVRQATHLFNGMRGLHHREPGTVGGILFDERIYAQIIVDGIHLHPAVVTLAIQIKGIERSILITDAIRATGLSDGEFDLGGQTVTVAEGTARIANDSLAGSTLTMDQAIRNTMAFTGLDFHTVIKMATITPARAMGIEDQKGKVDIGMDADLAFFNSDHHIAASLVAGIIKYKDF